MKEATRKNEYWARVERADIAYVFIQMYHSPDTTQNKGTRPGFRYLALLIFSYILTETHLISRAKVNICGSIERGTVMFVLY